jgi:hypothetical protein
VADERVPLISETEAGRETVDGELTAGGSSGEAKGTGTFASPLRT